MQNAIVRDSQLQNGPEHTQAPQPEGDHQPVVDRVDITTATSEDADGITGWGCDVDTFLRQEKQVTPSDTSIGAQRVYMTVDEKAYILTSLQYFTQQHGVGCDTTVAWANEMRDNDFAAAIIRVDVQSKSINQLAIRFLKWLRSKPIAEAGGVSDHSADMQSVEDATHGNGDVQESGPSDVLACVTDGDGTGDGHDGDDARIDMLSRLTEHEARYADERECDPPADGTITPVAQTDGAPSDHGSDDDTHPSLPPYDWDLDAEMAELMQDSPPMATAETATMLDGWSPVGDDKQGSDGACSSATGPPDSTNQNVNAMFSYAKKHRQERKSRVGPIPGHKKDKGALTDVQKAWIGQQFESKFKGAKPATKDCNTIHKLGTEVGKLTATTSKSAVRKYIETTVHPALAGKYNSAE